MRLAGACPRNRTGQFLSRTSSLTTPPLPWEKPTWSLEHCNRRSLWERANLSTVIRRWLWKGCSTKTLYHLRGQDESTTGGREGVSWGYVDISVIEAWACSKLNLISRGQLNREKGAARSAPLGWVPCQIWPKLRGRAEKSKASTRAGAATVSHSVWEMEPVTLQHLPTILLSICWFTYQETVVCACVRTFGLAMCVWQNGCFHLGRCVCTRTDREGIEL